MDIYYSALILMGVLSVCSIQLCIGQSTSLTLSQKKLFRLLFGTIAIASVCEWLGVCLQDTGNQTRLIHIAVKVIELSIAPSISVWVAFVIEKWHPKAVVGALAVHAFVEFLSGFFGFIFSVDAGSVYSHGRFYPVYVVAYILSIAYCVCVVWRNVKKYQYGGVSFFMSITAVMLVGIVIQLCNSELRVVYFTLFLTSILMYVFTLEMIFQTDALTQLINRRGFDNFVHKIERPCVLVFFDVDDFKRINDVYGHAFGDEVLKTVGKAIREKYSRFGRCFRYGGDEFFVALTRNTDGIDEINSSFALELERLRREEARLPFVSIGYAHFNPDTESFASASERADQMMYKYKQEHKALRQLHN